MAVSDECFCFVGDSVRQYEDLYYGLLDFVASEGPFDGLIGFSEGGAVAAWMLLENSRYPSRFGSFKCAIFFSAAVPFDPDVVRSGEMKAVDLVSAGEPIRIPTAHIWSNENDVNEERARALTRLCDADLRETFVHSLGHHVPGSKSDESLFGTIRVIEHAIERVGWSRSGLLYVYIL
ncbi:serine hydrolase-domain-containing protein [Xylariaceae sp. FL0255]|nr:serine hydrolase-domain-containing protein [Xylariaceae sp. FL0255]